MTFQTTSANGFHITFANGYTVSVQWNSGNYCEPRGDVFTDTKTVARKCTQAEVAAWNDAGWVQLSTEDDVIGWQSPDEVLAIMQKVAAL